MQVGRPEVRSLGKGVLECGVMGCWSAGMGAAKLHYFITPSLRYLAGETPALPGGV